MASIVDEVPPDDDDAWLYGDNNADEQRKEEITAIFERASEDVRVPGEESPKLDQNGDIGDVPESVAENGIEAVVADATAVDTEDKLEAQGNEEKDSDDDDSDDDDVQITIGDIKPSTTAYPYGGTPVNLNIKRGNVFSTGTAIGSGIKSKGIDLETIGVINGVSIYEFNLDSIEDKPWRKPGADITDYFNYGFNEDSWKAYCEKQRKLRLENNTPLAPSNKDQQIPIATVNENSKYAGYNILTKKAGPPPGRRTSGSIDVICGANSAARRAANAKENMIQVMTGRTDFDGTVPPGLPPTHLPPPFIPPNLSVPPPGLHPGIPPPTIPPPGHVPYPADVYGNPVFSQPPPPVPGVVDLTPQYDEQYFTGSGGQSSTSHAYDANSETTQQSWNNSPRDRDRERDRDRDRDRERHRDRSRDRDRDRYGGWERDHERDRSGGRMTDEEYAKRREEYERRRYERRDYRDRRDKDRHEEKRDSRERERDRDRERKHRDYSRDDRHRDRSSRRRHHHEEEDDHHSSRHKHKKSKRDKEDSNPDVSDNASQQEPEHQEEPKT